MLKSDFKYKSDFTSGRPSYYGADSRLIDIVRSEFYHNMKAGIDAFTYTAKNDYYKIKNLFTNSGLVHERYKNTGKIRKVDTSFATASTYNRESIDTKICTKIEDTKVVAKTSNTSNSEAILALSLGLGVSAISNYFVTGMAAADGFTYEGIDWRSFFGEQVPHTLISAGVYLSASWKKGKTFNETWKELLYIIAPLTGTISFIPYRLSRNFISNSLMDMNLAPPEATLIAQGILFIPYLMAVNYSLKKVKSTKVIQTKLEQWHDEGIQMKNGKNMAA